jgi:hypothetical protein
MGNNVVIQLLTDYFSEFEKNPEAFLETIRVQMNSSSARRDLYGLPGVKVF